MSPTLEFLLHDTTIAVAVLVSIFSIPTFRYYSLVVQGHIPTSVHVSWLLLAFHAYHLTQYYILETWFAQYRTGQSHLAPVWLDKSLSALLLIGPPADLSSSPSIQFSHLPLTWCFSPNRESTYSANSTQVELSSLGLVMIHKAFTTTSQVADSTMLCIALIVASQYVHQNMICLLTRLIYTLVNR